MHYAFSSSHHFGPRNFELFIRWCDVHSTGTRKRAIVIDHPAPFRALTSEEKLWSNKVFDLERVPLTPLVAVRKSCIVQIDQQDLMFNAY